MGQFERDASPRRLPQFSKREAVRLLSHRNVLRLAAWPRRGVLAYERGDGVSAESDFWWRYVEGSCMFGVLWWSR